MCGESNRLPEGWRIGSPNFSFSPSRWRPAKTPFRIVNSDAGLTAVDVPSYLDQPADLAVVHLAT
jgi:hypothetical protein